ncbi:MAG: Mur ligase family protein [Clostridium sp.]
MEGHTCEVETYGFGEDADLRASNVHLMDKGGTLGVAYHMSGALDMDVEIDIPGTFSVYNSMTAIAICRHFGVQKETILNSLSQIRVKGRVEILPVSSKFTLMIDYAHNAMSLESLLSGASIIQSVWCACLDVVVTVPESVALKWERFLLRWQI